MENKVIVITGASDGIGAEAARMLRNSGATVVVIGRTPEKTKQFAESINANYHIVDFSELAQVRALATILNESYPTIDVLINNAGGIFGKRQITTDGNEKTLQVNHLAPFLLTNLLMDTLLRSQATVINVSSVASRLYGDLKRNGFDLVSEYSPNRAYGNSKLANVIFTKELDRRYRDQGLRTVAVHPGNVRTNFASHTTSNLRFVYHTAIGRLFLISPQEGAASLVWLASSRPGEDWQPGRYYDRYKLGKENIQAYDQNLAEVLWSYSQRHTGLI